jgi:short chain dehydrogenase
LDRFKVQKIQKNLSSESTAWVLATAELTMRVALQNLLPLIASGVIFAVSVSTVTTSGVAAFTAPRPTIPATSTLKQSLQDGDNVMPGRTRRDVLTTDLMTSIAASFAVSSFGAPAGAAGDDNLPQTVVLTGANSGIGLEAVRRWATLSGNGQSAPQQIVLACRTMDKARETIDKIQSYTSGSGTLRLVPAECDLASLDSIQRFAAELPKSIDSRLIDSLCLNAGISRNTAATDVARTRDGFELTGKCSCVVCRSLRSRLIFCLPYFLRVTIQLVPIIWDTFIYTIYCCP